MSAAPVIALSHGGGPLPILGDPDHKDIIFSLKSRVPQILGLGTASQPRAILLVTAHWSTPKPAISSGATHELLYDYYNFPREAYALKYPAPGAPDVAEEVRGAMVEAGLAPVMDAQRGWDHGVFVPMSLVHPKADIPIVQLSVLRSEDPETHLRMGAALSRLRWSNVAVIGSGFASWHNLRDMMAMRGASPGQRKDLISASKAWNEALTEAATTADQRKRWEKLRRWRDLPHAYEMHPRGGGEHFMPLLVCAGAAEDGESGKFYKDVYQGVDILTYYWGAEAEVSA